MLSAIISSVELLGICVMAARQTLTLFVRVQILHPQPKNSTSFDLSNFFIQAAGLAYHHDAVVDIISPVGAVSHHALACIYLRLDDIQHFVLVIYNSYGIDDIHAFGVIWHDGLEISTILCYTNHKKAVRI